MSEEEKRNPFVVPRFIPKSNFWMKDSLDDLTEEERQFYALEISLLNHQFEREETPVSPDRSS